MIGVFVSFDLKGGRCVKLRAKYVLFTNYASNSMFQRYSYNGLYVNTDKSVAYYIQSFERNSELKPHCIEISFTSLSQYKLSDHDCRAARGSQEKVPAKKYVCEVEKPSTQHSINRRPHLARPPVHAWVNMSVVTCPARHVTRQFLACDVKANCWSQDTSGYNDEDRKSWAVPSRHSCQAPLTSLPPSFLCTVGRQRVPYTLLCDHRHDCVDGSDEDFCHFPPCARDHQSCGSSKQVRTTSVVFLSCSTASLA